MLMVIILSTGFSSCSKDDDSPSNDSIVGVWVMYGGWDEEINDNLAYYYVFKENGEWEYYNNFDYTDGSEYYEYGIWNISGDILDVTYQGYYEYGNKNQGETKKLTYIIQKLTQKELVLVEDDGDEEKWQRVK